VSEALVLLLLPCFYLLYCGCGSKTRFSQFLPFALTNLNPLERQATGGYMSESALQIGGIGVP
jgi:hypothetical protein